MTNAKIAAGLFSALSSLTVALFAATAALAHEATLGDLSIAHPWTYPTPNATTPAAVYLVIENNGAEDDRLIAVSSPMAQSASVHETMLEGDMAGMRPVEQVTIPAGDLVSFEPGGLHIMLGGLERALSEGERVPLMLRFEKAGSIEVEALVEPMGMGPSHDH